MLMSYQNGLKIAAILAVITFIHLYQLYERQIFERPEPKLGLQCGHLIQQISEQFAVNQVSQVDFGCSKRQKCRQLFHFNRENSTLEVIGSSSNLLLTSCTYRSFGFDQLREKIAYGQWHEWDLSENLTIDEDFVNVQCGVNGAVCNTVYFGFNATKMENRKDLSGDDFNVVMLVLDGMSQFIFRPLLSETEDLLNSWPNAIEFKYHHRVGLNSFPNMGPYLTGLTFPYLQEHKFIELLGNTTPSWPLSDFIWKRFSDIGYATYLMLDEKPVWYIDSPFNMLINQYPVDYNWWPFFKWINEYLCLSDTPLIHLQLDHLYHYTKRFSDKRIFFYAHLGYLTHDYMYRDGKLLDRPLVDLLAKWKLDGFLNKTILFLMADHGCRFELPRKINETAKRLQENMPFLRVILPDSFKLKYPKLVETMRENTRKLTSQYDVHATLVHLLQLVDKRDYKHVEFGKSLFDHLGTRKTCADAHVPANFCSCHL